MKRREVIKGLAALGALAFLPNVEVMGNQPNRNLHFVGLGGGGTCVMMHIHKKGIKAKYSCIGGSYIKNLTPDMEHLCYETSLEYRKSAIQYKKQLAITPEMKTLFKEDDRYVILAGLGGFACTGLISNLLDFIQAEQKNYLAIFSIPSFCEGRARREYAIYKMNELENIKNVLSFDQQLMAKEFEKQSIRKMFEKVNQQYYNLFKAFYPQFSD